MSSRLRNYLVFPAGISTFSLRHGNPYTGNQIDPDMSPGTASVQ